MTIASEITRLQGAKASAKTSIENKGVTVPADAKVDTYHTYIDQIVALSTLSGLKLNNVRVTNYDASPTCGGVLSFEEDGKLYGCCGTIQERGNSNTANCCLYTFRKITTGDIQYQYNEGGSFNGYYGSCRVDAWKAYTDGTNIKFYVFSWYYPASTSTPNYMNMWEFTRSYKTTLTPSWRLAGTGTSTDPADYSGVDLTGYTETRLATWVASATGNEIDDDGYIYLTLK